MQGSWIAISVARARAHALYGVRGWLITLLWLTTLPVLAMVLGMTAAFMLRVTGGEWVHPLLVLPWLVCPLVLVALAFLRVRWFPVLWFAYCLFQLPIAFYIGSLILEWLAQASSHAAGKLPVVLLFALQVLTPFVTMAYIVRSRRVRVTYRHQVRFSDPAAAPAVFDRPDPNETPTDATDHARERAALRRVAQELSSGVLDTQTWMQIVRDYADTTDSERTAAYVRARMAELCPPAHVHPPLLRTLASAVGALLVSVVATALLAAVVIALARWLPGATIERLAIVIVLVLLLCWLAGLAAGARFLRRVA
ncbi:hypothetical protein [Ralstonia sp. UBA689]|uniref:hypothetical protein n=1 Tax=Ralstonia sp. UBA689 TaxID=1947373 RepID=UPI0025E98DD4|nr:hypothetical protein [Ralstonia sp. UBA689]